MDIPRRVRRSAEEMTLDQWQRCTVTARRLKKERRIWLCPHPIPGVYEQAEPDRPKTKANKNAPDQPAVWAHPVSELVKWTNEGRQEGQRHKWC